MNKIGLRKLNPISEKYKKLFLQDIENKKIELEDVTTCICCGSQDFEQLLEVDRFDLPFGSYICKECGLITTSPRIKQESLPYYYETYYHPLNYGKESLNNHAALFQPGQGIKIYHKLERYIINNKKTLSVLEIGAGVGNVLEEFHKEAAKNHIETEIIGTEYSPECIVQCRKKKIEMIEGNATSILKLKKKFDIIILSHVFEHFIDLNNELKILKQLLHTEGLLYIEVPGLLRVHDKPYYDFSFLGYSVHAHMYNFSSTTLQNIVEKQGYKLKESNEEVEAVFRLDNSISPETTNDYLQIKNYLNFLENDSLPLKNRIIVRNEKIEKYETMIENRNKDIEKYKTQVENRKKEIETIRKVKNELKNIKFSRSPISKYKAYKNLLKAIK